MLKKIESKVQEETEESKQKEIIQVVDKLPVQEIRTMKREDGITIRFVTILEYLSAQANAGNQ